MFQGDDLPRAASGLILPAGAAFQMQQQAISQEREFGQAMAAFMDRVFDVMHKAMLLREQAFQDAYTRFGRPAGEDMDAIVAWFLDHPKLIPPPVRLKVTGSGRILASWDFTDNRLGVDVQGVRVEIDPLISAFASAADSAATEVTE